MQNKPELLAPVGSWEALLAAVNNGADAVYLGGKMFSARAFANNFDHDEMNRAVMFCHLRGVKVYVTVNTLVADQEMEEVTDYLKFLYETGVDAVIVQDLGVARVARAVLPELEIHASTQMTVYNEPGVEILLEHGFKRIVLAREMGLEDIKSIKANTGAELEVFIHGALCISYSGQCLMSSLIGGRSGNRGRCAQPCRLAYTLVDRQGKVLAEQDNVGKHLLSPRDLNMLHHIPDLVAAGIDSFKIEGRMKRPEYVATVIRVYRQALDRYLENPNEFAVAEEEDKALWQIFNRDFTTGYFYGTQGSDMMSYKRPNNRGVRLGRVTAFKSQEGKVEIALEEPLHPGDGLEAWVTQGGRKGSVVHRIFMNGQVVDKAMPGDKVWVELPGKIRTGDRVFKTHDATLMERAALSYTSAKAGEKISLQCTVSGDLGQPLTITFRHPEGFIGQAKTDFIAEAALKRPLSRETVLKQIERLGNTPFIIGAFDYAVNGEIMVPVSEINEARRRAIEIMERQIIKAQKPEPVAYNDYTESKKNILLPTTEKGMVNAPLLAVTVGDLTALRTAVLAGANVVYLSGDHYRCHKPYDAENIKAAVDLCREKGVELLYQTPRIARDDEIAIFADELAAWQDVIEGILCTNLGFLQKYRRNEIKVLADYTLNIFNNQSLEWLLVAGADRATLSPELTLAQVQQLSAHAPLDVEFIVQGSLPMMVSEYCAPGSVLGGLYSASSCKRPCRTGDFGLKDRLGMVFPVEVDGFCHMHIFNPKELSLIEEIGELARSGVKYLRIEGKKETSAYLQKVVALYRQEIDRYMANPGQFRGNQDIKEKLNLLSPAGTTKGHLYRGVI